IQGMTTPLPHARTPTPHELGLDTQTAPGPSAVLQAPTVGEASDPSVLARGGLVGVEHYADDERGRWVRGTQGVGCMGCGRGAVAETAA
ncbi:hypothetical protein DXG01_007733, partial [Tephrocybe rancida]